MKISTSKTLPSTQELAAILKQEFADHYSYQEFGLGSAKSILVGKSTFVGAQISVSENEITIQGTPPSLFAGFLALLSLTELGFVVVLFTGLPWSFTAQLRVLEKEVGVFLKHKYN